MNDLPSILSEETPRNYNALPSSIFLGRPQSILDIGCMSGKNAVSSVHGPHFYQASDDGRYLGIDIQEYPRKYLNPIIETDILEFQLEEQFDLVLCLHVAEHIAFEQWPKLFDNLKTLVKPNGILVIQTPYRQRPRTKKHKYDHVVFGITEKTIEEFLPNAEYSKYVVPYRHFRAEGESMFKAVVRAFWRLISRHPLRYKRELCITAIWKKDSG